MFYVALLLKMLNLCSTYNVSAHFCVSAGEWVVEHLAEHLKLRPCEQQERGKTTETRTNGRSRVKSDTLVLHTRGLKWKDVCMLDQTSLWERVGVDGKKKKKRMCSLLVHMAIRREVKLQGLILQQQPACLLTALWAFAVAQMPRGRFTWL